MTVIILGPPQPSKVIVSAQTCNFNHTVPFAIKGNIFTGSRDKEVDFFREPLFNLS